LTAADLVVANGAQKGAVKLLSVKIKGQLGAAHVGIAHPAADKQGGKGKGNVPNDEAKHGQSSGCECT
jgi:hydroxymethylglutaryl-CoA reductase